MSEAYGRLRAPFPTEVVGKLPRVFCGACREASKAAKRQAACQNHRVEKCRICGNNITTGHLHLDYVGHAETTDRLLQVDPAWTWEPFAVGTDGLPALDRFGGLWIRLTVVGVTRPGYGSAGEKTGPDAMKEAIGDAIRNAAMRFGVALDLWGATYKGDDGDSGEAAYAEPAEPNADQVTKFDTLAKTLAAAESDEQLKTAWTSVVAAYKADEITTVQANQLRTDLDAYKKTIAGAS